MPNISIDDLIARRRTMIPVKRSKAPMVPWKQFQQRRPSEAEIIEMEKPRSAGLGCCDGSSVGPIHLGFRRRIWRTANASTPPPAAPQDGKRRIHVDFRHP